MLQKLILFLRRENVGQEKHLQNKRECFDGMRAYHQSEIAHKKDTIEILKSILTTIVLVYGAIIGAIITKSIESVALVVVSFFTLILIAISVLSITYVTNNKIDKDNARYRKYEEEYVIERQIIGLESELLKLNHESVWIDKTKDKNKTGYHHTKLILWVFSVIIILVSLVGTSFSVGAYFLQIGKEKESQLQRVTNLESNIGEINETLTLLKHQISSIPLSNKSIDESLLQQSEKHNSKD